MKNNATNNLINQLIKITYKLNELEKIPIDFGTDELLYPSEIHTIDAVGDQFGITKGAVSQIIIKLNKKGYIQKIRNEAYSKEIILSLTEKGFKAYQTHKKLHEIMDKGLMELIDNYSDEWLQTFRDMLTKLEKQVDKYMHLGEVIKFL
jgi:DNA-binding MarR family transcriptional regulator